MVPSIPGILAHPARTSQVTAMESVREDRFIVFIRLDGNHDSRPDDTEREYIDCSSYAEARQIQRDLQQHGTGGVIRYVGAAGGGD